MEHAAAMQRDDAPAFEALLEEHRGIVLKVAAGYARDHHERADLAQEIAAQLWRAWPGFDPKQRFSTWMYRIALNVGISHLRGAGRRERVLTPLDEAAHEAGRAVEGDVQVPRGLRHGSIVGHGDGGAVAGAQHPPTQPPHQGDTT